MDRCAARRRLGSAPQLFQQFFELCEDLFDRIEVRRILRQEEPPRALGADSFVDRRALGGAEIVHDDDVATLQGRRKNLLDIGQKAFAVDRPVAYEGPRDFVTSRRRGMSSFSNDPAAPWR
jgi:hypothetical protein